MRPTQYDLGLNSLSAALVTAMGGLDEGLGRLRGIGGLLADDSNTALLVGDDTNSLIISGISIRARS
jgi:hypothetical protein